MSIVARRRRESLVMASVIDIRNSAAGMHEFSISFLCRPKQYTDMLRARLSPLGEEYGMSSTPETGRLACTSAEARFNAARDSISIYYRAGESNVEITAVSAHKSHCANAGTDSNTLGAQGGLQAYRSQPLLSANEGRRRACYVSRYKYAKKPKEEREK